MVSDPRVCSPRVCPPAPWTYRQIARYLGLTNENAVKYHVRTAMESPEVQSLFSELCGGIN